MKYPYKTPDQIQRCAELRSTGYPISTTMIRVFNRYGEAVRVAEWRKA